MNDDIPNDAPDQASGQTPGQDPGIDEILAFWFDNSDTSRNHLWFARSDEFDREIRTRFGALVSRATAGELGHWCESARGRLALIILLDQFTRNLHRESADAYASDALAQSICIDGLQRGHDRELPLIQRWFFYMPLEHAEDLALQEQSVACFERLRDEAPPDKRGLYQSALEHAQKYRDTIARFGRFPHRNRLLGRTSSADEEAYLASGGSR